MASEFKNTEPVAPEYKPKDILVVGCGNHGNLAALHALAAERGLSIVTSENINDLDVDALQDMFNKLKDQPPPIPSSLEDLTPTLMTIPREFRPTRIKETRRERRAKKRKNR